MKAFKKIAAAGMCLAVIFSATACDEELPVNSNMTSSAPTLNTTAAANQQGSDNTAGSDFEYKPIKDAAIPLIDKLDNKDLNIEKRIKWMAWYQLDESTPAAELFKAAYGVPNDGDDSSATGRIFEYISVGAYKDRFDKLATAISVDDSPDLFPFEIADFPYGIVNNRYQPVDDMINIDSDKWRATKKLMDQFVISGKHYVVFNEISMNNLMWYRKSNIEAIGAQDPQELFNQGKWDWDAFLELARKWHDSGTDDNPRFVTDGYDAESEFVVSTGVPMVGFNGKELKNNLHDPAVERAMSLVATLQSENLRYPRHELNNYDTNYNAWANGTNLFFCEGVWRYESDLQYYRKKYKWADDEIKVVPFPKDPLSDKYYVQLKQDAFMYVSGSKNKEGVQAWIDCWATAANDETIMAAQHDQLIANPKMGYTEELLSFIESLKAIDGSSPVTPIVEYKHGLGPKVFDSNTAESPVVALTSHVYLQGESYSQLREANEGAINLAIVDINQDLLKY